MFGGDHAVGGFMAKTNTSRSPIGLARLPRRLTAILLATAACSGPAPVVQLAPASVTADGAIVLRNGLNDIPLLGDNTPARVFVTWRGNYNAHGYSVAEFAVRTSSDLGDAAIWQDVPFFGGPRDG